MAGNDAATKFVETLNEGYDAVIDAVRAGNDRGHRVTTALIEDAQRGQREVLELATKWADAPLDVMGFYGSVVDTGTKAQGRALEVARLWFAEVTQAQEESRELFQKLASANRGTGEAALGVARSAFTRAGEAVQSASRSAGALGDGRRSNREAAKSTGASADDSSSE